ncbi:MAG: NF038122 family metalloprotease [Kiritimatiellaeota bacterium]|nr:NF038122 family metalloprotease [Kiritimatiellota bacterium]
MRRILFAIYLGVHCLGSIQMAHALSFNLTYDPSMAPEAISGFNMAANLWSAVLADNITINLFVGYQDISNPNIIAQTATGDPQYWAAQADSSYTTYYNALMSHRTSADDFLAVANLPSGPNYSRLINNTIDNPNGPYSATPYLDSMDWVGVTRANAKALGLTLADPNGLDGSIVFNTYWSNSFDFAHGPTIDPLKMDFVGAAAHEIGHVLGFTSGVDDIDNNAYGISGTNFSVNAIDLFRYSALSLSNGVIDYTADTREKYFSLDGGSNAIAYFSTGVNSGDGQQASHWLNVSPFPRIGIMGPTAMYGEKLDVTDIDQLAMDAIGYSLIPEPGTSLFIVLGVALFMGRRTWLRQRGV